ETTGTRGPPTHKTTNAQQSPAAPAPGRPPANPTRTPTKTPAGKPRPKTKAPATCAIPVAPPINIMPTKLADQAHTARCPLSAAHTPTASMAVTWSTPVNGCATPVANDSGDPRPG